MKYKITPRDYDFMKQAMEIGTQSSCIRPMSRFGAIAVKDDKVLVSGWNGHLGNIESCKIKGSCIRQEKNIPSGTQREVAHCICAEQRLICNAAKDGISINGAMIYVTGVPCKVCIRLIKAAGVKRVIHTEDYACDKSDDMAKLVGLDMIKIDL